MTDLPTLELEIIRYNDAVKHDPTDTKSKGKLDYRLSKWIDKLDITVFVAQNEQLPWSENEIGYPMRPMPPKQTCTFNQVGDYQFFIDGHSGHFQDKFGGLLVERKTCQDFYGTLFGNRERFYREIDRFHADPRFDKMIIVVECDTTSWLHYMPPNTREKTSLVPQKIASLASLENRGVSVVFAGDRTLATRFYRDCIRMWCMRNYEKIIGIGEPVVDTMVQPCVVEELGFS
ncbi:ERCC4 domain-containing protein [Methanolobus sp. ZRKC3]|uniref:ERCC4 domain-containing protein n=1 Tax=Methanolobus sp. ZRKC3 TaxID=3125786 RepID=UPI003244FB81